jgi:hypothetical protein
VGMRLEAVDRANPSLICVAHIKQIRPDGQKLLISFDGWSDLYDYWVRDVAPPLSSP